MTTIVPSIFLHVYAYMSITYIFISALSCHIFQVTYHLTAFIEKDENQEPGPTHYTSYKKINDVWVQFYDDETAVVPVLLDYYTGQLMLYRREDLTSPYVIRHIEFPKPLKTYSRRRRQVGYITPGL